MLHLMQVSRKLLGRANKDCDLLLVRYSRIRPGTGELELLAKTTG